MSIHVVDCSGLVPRMARVGTRHHHPHMVIRRTLAALVDRPLQLPAWALLAQLFLAAGWLRAASAHALSADWWSGEEIRRFATAAEFEPVGSIDIALRELVIPSAEVLAVIVVVAQLLVGVLLVLNVRTVVALVVGAVMNLAFMLCGAVNPSVFYLIIAGVLLARLAESNLDRERAAQLALNLTFATIGTTALLSPSVRSLAPDDAIEDPALVLLFLNLLLLGTLWRLGRRAAGVGAASDLGLLAAGSAPGDPGPSPSSSMPVVVQPGATVAEAGLDRPRYGPKHVVAEVERRTGQRLSLADHARLARRAGVRPEAGQRDRTVEPGYACYVSKQRSYLYSDAWIDRLGSLVDLASGLDEHTGPEGSNGSVGNGHTPERSEGAVRDPVEEAAVVVTP